MIDARANERVDILLQRNIAARKPSGGTELARERFTLAAFDVRNNDACTLRYVGARDALTEPARAPGDDRDLAFELVHVFSLIGGR